jgi:hypothetical protein
MAHHFFHRAGFRTDSIFLGESGGIGRRAGFRFQWGNPWEFESPLSHHGILAVRRSLPNPGGDLNHGIRCAIHGNTYSDRFGTRLCKFQ